ncbi:MAG TPA: mechanosensitive ion channel domain-containing protein [Azonexus sp.]|nr:mechanosensitive ion channel domain-containing protein [Azonexus sp.]
MNWFDFLLPDASPALGFGLECGLAVLLGLLLHAVIHRIARRLASGFVFARNLVAYGRRPLQLLLPLLLLQVALGDVPDGLLPVATLRHLLNIAQLATLTFFCIRLVKSVEATVIDLNPAEVADNLRARSVHTQARVLARSVILLLILVGLAQILMTFPGIRQIGASLLASAGLAALVAGIAARPVFSNLIAGLQIALTQPIRIDDVLIVEGEWGRVEEITGTYVVVRIWDERRLIVPLDWFIQHPFENWTRSTTHLLGTVFLWVDYAMPLAPLREELERVCRAAPEWDSRLCLLQVTDSTERAMQLRVLVSAANSSQTWDLRCRVREALVAFIQAHHADCLPRLRGALDNAPAPAGGADRP